MKIICASFQCESNSLASFHPQKNDFVYASGEEALKKLAVKEIFEEAGFEVVPSIYAVALPSGTVEKHIYMDYANQILDTVRENSDAVGIYIWFHGSMEVDEIGSGELYLLKEIRKIVGDGPIISMTMDAHANITDELSQYAEITSGFKTVPHVDQVESQERAANALVKALKTGKRPKMYIQRVPFLLKNDNVKTVEEPLGSLVEETKELEKLEGVYSVNLFLGHCWVDAKNVSASVVVSADDLSEAEKIAKTMANKLWATRADYKFNVEADEAEACVDLAISGKENRIFITDSGDNTTAGAEGDKTEILRLLIAKNVEKKTCVAGITNKKLVDDFWEKRDGEEIYLAEFGKNAKIKAHGEILGWGGEPIGRALTVSIGNVDVIFTEARSSYEFKKSFEYSNVNLLEYRIVVLKMGYLFTTMKPYADRELFALTDGSSCVELKRLNLKNIIRPMYPLDDFEFKA